MFKVRANDVSSRTTIELTWRPDDRHNHHAAAADNDRIIIRGHAPSRE